MDDNTVVTSLRPNLTANNTETDGHTSVLISGDQLVSSNNARIAVAPGLSENLTETPRLSARHNRYVTRKTAAQGMMDVALLLVNASQLKSVVGTGPSHTHYVFLMILICLSITLQIVTGILLLIVGSREAKSKLYDEDMDTKCNRLNNTTVACVFFITVINIFIASFGIRDGDNESVLSLS